MFLWNGLIVKKNIVSEYFHSSYSPALQKLEQLKQQKYLISV